MARVFRIEATEREQIIAALTESLHAEPEISFAYLHGSLLGGPGVRDIDVGIYFAASADRHTERSLALSGRFSVRIGFPVDIRPLNAAPVSFLFHVFRTGRLLLSRDEELIAEDLTARLQQMARFRNLLVHVRFILNWELAAACAGNNQSH